MVERTQVRLLRTFLLKITAWVRASVRREVPQGARRRRNGCGLPPAGIEGPSRRGLDGPGGAKRSRPAGSGVTGAGAGRLGTGPRERPGSQPPIEGRIGATRPLRCAGVTPEVDASFPDPERATRPTIYWMVRGAMPLSRGMRTGDFSLTGHPRA